MVCIFVEATHKLECWTTVTNNYLLDRVFVKAITTIKALSSRSNYGSLPRPPAENRIRLYGLYKQATEGNVEGIMTRPVGFSMEDEGAKKKWDAWKREEGLSKTEAKRRYISYLIDTMKIYASGTLEARELLSELEYLWDQIKDIPFDNDYELDEANNQVNYPLPSRSPLFSQAGQSDRFSTNTPLPLASNYSGSVVPNQHYRNNLHKIYSHSRRSTMLSINDYVNQQRNNPLSNNKINDPQTIDASIYSLPGVDNRKHTTQSIHSLPAQNNTNQQTANESTFEDFKNWQGEINLIINKLSKEFLNSKAAAAASKRNGRYGGGNAYAFNRNSIGNRTSSDSGNSEDSGSDVEISLKKRVIHILKIIGMNAIKFLKNFLVSLLAILFIVWCFKKNVIVERTFVKQPVGNNKQKREMIINMILNTDENKWFIRLLNVVNSFVGFV